MRLGGGGADRLQALHEHMQIVLEELTLHIGRRLEPLECLEQIVGTMAYPILPSSTRSAWRPECLPITSLLSAQPTDSGVMIS